MIEAMRPATARLSRLANVMRGLMLSWLGAFVLASPAYSASFGAYNPAPQYSETTTTSFYVRMRDGVRIAMQVVRPARNGKPVEGRFPVIWQAGLDLPGPPRAERAGWAELAKQGYVIVDVARRGAGASFGVRRGYPDRQEAYDSYEITEWLAKQPWSTGKVGMHGCSNTAAAVVHAMSVEPPSLKAAWAGCFVWSAYDSSLRGSGIIANWGAGPQRTFEEDMTSRPVDGDQDKVLLAQAAREHQENSNLVEARRAMRFRDSWVPQTRSRSAVEGSAGAYAAQIAHSGVPLYIQGGWLDDTRQSNFISFANVPNARIVMGPWTHCANGDFNLIGEALRFFDYHLKGVDTGIAQDDPIHYWVMGAPKGQEWRAAKAWFPASSNSSTLYLSADDRLVAQAPRRTSEAAFAINYDPQCPAMAGKPGVVLQPCPAQPGSAQFTGPVTTRDTELTGFPVLKVWVAADAADADVFAYLEDVAPDGKAQALTDGRQRLSLRKLATPPWAYYDLPWKRAYAEDAEPLTPSKPVEVVIDMLPISYILPAGHRLRMTVAGADYRQSEKARVQPTRLTVLSGSEFPSAISLPAR